MTNQEMKDIVMRSFAKMSHKSPADSMADAKASFRAWAAENYPGWHVDDSAWPSVVLHPPFVVEVTL